MIEITKKVTGASRFAIWILPIVSLIFFFLPYIPIISRIKFIFIWIRKLVATYIGVVLPGYDTFKIIEHRKNVDPMRMLSYWLVVAVLYSTTGAIGMIILPDLFELIFYISLIGLPMFKYLPSVVAYNVLIRPSFNFIRHTYGNTKPDEPKDEKDEKDD